MSESHPNNNPLTPNTNGQDLPQSFIYPLFKELISKRYPFESDGFDVTGFKCKGSGEICVDCQVVDSPFSARIPGEDFNAALTTKMKSSFGVSELSVISYRLATRDNPYLVVDYTIVLPSEVDND